MLASQVLAADALPLAQANRAVPTLVGEEIKLRLSGDDLMIDDAKVTAADVMASNGVVHLVRSWAQCVRTVFAVHAWWCARWRMCFLFLDVRG